MSDMTWCKCGHEWDCHGPHGGCASAYCRCPWNRPHPQMKGVTATSA